MAKMLGLQSLKRKLGAIPEAVVAPIRAQLQAMAEEMVAVARALVPVDEGDLRDSIGWTFGSAPRGSIRLAQSVVNRSDFRVVVFAGSQKAFYARWQEFGTPQFSAQPFFFPAYRSVRRGSAARMSRTVNAALRRVAK